MFIRLVDFVLKGRESKQPLLVQVGSSWFKLVQVGSSWFKLVQVCIISYLSFIPHPFESHACDGQCWILEGDAGDEGRSLVSVVAPSGSQP